MKVVELLKGAYQPDKTSFIFFFTKENALDQKMFKIIDLKWTWKSSIHKMFLLKHETRKLLLK